MAGAIRSPSPVGVWQVGESCGDFARIWVVPDSLNPAPFTNNKGIPSFDHVE